MVTEGGKLGANLEARSLVKRLNMRCRDVAAGTGAIRRENTEAPVCSFNGQF